MIRFIFTLLFSLSCINAVAGEWKAGFQAGMNFDIDVGRAYGNEYAGRKNLGPGYGDLRKSPPKGGIVGFDLNYFFNNYFGINFLTNYTQFRSRTQNVYLGTYNDGAQFSHNFTPFKIKGFMFGIGPVFRLKIDDSLIFNTFNPYIGISVVAFRGRMTNAEYDLNANKTLTTNGDPTYTIPEETYGHSGTKEINGYGSMLRAGFTYDINKRFDIGAEIRRTYLTLQGKQMRSFHDGFETNINFSSAMLNLGFKF